jgi:Tfp pilus assembly protein PilF
MAVALDSEDMQARYALARALVGSGNLAEALENFHKVADAQPRDAEIRDEFGEWLMRNGKLAEALEQFNAALAIDPAQKAALRDRDLAIEQLKVR